jgi:hypothetical protein
MFLWSLLKPCQREIEARVAEARALFGTGTGPSLICAPRTPCSLLTECNPLAAV